MAKSTPLYVGLDVHKDSIAVAHATGGRADPPVFVGEQVDRLARLEAEALTVVAELGDLTRFGNPRQLAAFVGLVPSEYFSGASRRQGGITKAGHARRVLVEAAWAYRYPAKVSLHIQQRIDQ